MKEKYPATLFIIPARGGSKGIPGKNIKPLGGRPLILYALENARACANLEMGDEICVSTDSEEIRKIVEEAGQTVPFMRPESLATDTATTHDVLIHALKYYRDHGKTFDRLVLLQATSPFCRKEDVKGAMDLWRPDVDMVVSVKEASTNPYYNAYELEDGVLKISKGKGCFTRRQDAPKVWEYNGAVYVVTVESLMKNPMSRFERRIPYEMEASRSVDLDTPLDWMLAEMLMQKMRENGENQA